MLQNFCIFRGKIDPATGKDLIKLPKRTDEVITVNFTAKERVVYEHVAQKSLRSTFAKIMRLRQGVSYVLFCVLAFD